MDTPVSRLRRPCGADRRCTTNARPDRKTNPESLDLFSSWAEQGANIFQLGVAGFDRASKTKAAVHLKSLVEASAPVRSSRLTVAEGRALATEMKLIQKAEEAARQGTRAARGLGHLANGLAVVGGVVSGVEEAANSTAYTTTGGRVAGSIAVGGAQTVAGLTPHGTIANLVSGLVDAMHRRGQAWGVFGEGPPPKLIEVFNNAGRGVGTLVDVVTAWFEPATDAKGRPNHGAWDAVHRFTHHVKTEQGSVSRALASVGEWGGEKAYDAWFWVGSKLGFGEGGRAADLEAQRVKLLAGR